MSVIALPSGLKIASMHWEQIRNDLEFRSIFGAQVLEASAPLWGVSLVAAPLKESGGGTWQALLMQLRGKSNQLSLHNVVRPVPLGTMRGTMVLNTAAAQGATTLGIISAGETTKTLLKGDLLGLGSGATQQVVMVVADATSNGSGVISATIEPPLRNAHSGGAAVTWNAPTALFRCREAPAKWDYQPGLIVSGFALNLIEDVRA